MKTELYKLDANNKVRIWRIWTEHFASNSVVYTQYGVNGHSPTLNKTDFRGYDHEAKSKQHQDVQTTYMKNRKGYTDTIPLSRPYRPMLLQKYADKKDALPNRVFIQSKINGHRCMASSSWMMSRGGLKYTSCGHIQEVLSSFPEDVVLDGELYCHGLKRHEIESAVERIDPNILTRKIKYYIFDVVADLPFRERWEYLLELASSLSLTPTEPHLDNSPSPIQFLSTLEVTQDEVMEHYNYFLNQGYEGAVIRNPYSKYQLNTRVPGVLKLKPFQTRFFVIKDIVPYEKDKTQGKLVCVTSAGVTFKCTYKASQHMRNKILRLKSLYIGKAVKVEFEDFSEDGKPIQPIAKEIVE